MRTMIIVALVLIALPAAAQEKKPVFADLAPYVAVVAGNAADVLSTNAAFQRGAVEVNPITGFVGSSNIAPILIEKVAVTVTIIAAMRYYASHGHPKAAKVIGYLDGAGMLAVSAHNARVNR